MSIWCKRCSRWGSRSVKRRAEACVAASSSSRQRWRLSFSLARPARDEFRTPITGRGRLRPGQRADGRRAHAARAGDTGTDVAARDQHAGACPCDTGVARPVPATWRRLAACCRVRLRVARDDDCRGRPVVATALRAVITPGYAEALGMRLKEGRFFRAEDTTSAIRPMLVNATFAKTYFTDGRPATGRRFAGLFPKWLGKEASSRSSASSTTCCRTVSRRDHSRRSSSPRDRDGHRQRDVRREDRAGPDVRSVLPERVRAAAGARGDAEPDGSCRPRSLRPSATGALPRSCSSPSQHWRSHSPLRVSTVSFPTMSRSAAGRSACALRSAPRGRLSFAWCCARD